MSENKTRDFGIGSSSEPIGVTMDRWTAEAIGAREQLARYLNGDRDVLRSDDDRRPAFIEALWNDLESPPQPPPWPVPATHADNVINGIFDVPFGTYAWWVRRVQKTVDGVIRQED